MDDYLAQTIRTFNSRKIEMKNKDFDFPEKDNLPDGAYTIKSANSKQLSYNL